MEVCGSLDVRWYCGGSGYAGVKPNSKYGRGDGGSVSGGGRQVWLEWWSAEDRKKEFE